MMMLSKLKLKYIQSLGHKKFRDEEAAFIAEGPKMVSEFLQEKPGSVKEVFALKEWIRANRGMLYATGVIEVDESELEKLSSLSQPNQVLAVIGQFGVQQTPVAVNEKFVLVLDTIQDPGNLGTIIRIADWFGIEQIVCSKGCADIYNPKVVQATMGSILRVQVFYTELDAWLKEQKEVRIFATALEGQDVSTMKKVRGGIILVGNESRGLDPELIGLSNVKITIRRKGKAESLNAAVATGIVLSHLV